MITIGPLHSIWFGNRMSDEPEQTIFPPAEVRDKALQLLSLVICRIVDIGKSITTDRLHFERDKLKHGVVRLERSSFAFAFHKESQKEDEKRGKAIAYTAKEASTDMVHYNIIDPPGHRDFVRFQIDDIPEPCALFTAETTTFQCIQCYFVQGWFKCGGVEICKTRFAIGMNKKNARMNRDSSTLGGPVAEFVADVFLCPYEACRIRYILDPSYANGVLATGQKEMTYLVHKGKVMIEKKQ